MKSSIITVFAIVMAFAALGDAVRFDVQVIDERTALPVPGVEVSGGFKTDRGVWAKARYSYERKKYVTEENGKVEIRGTSNCGEAGWSVNRADGYYYPVHGSGVPRFRKKNLFGVWQPDNVVVTVKLQRVEHPIPLWVKKELLNVKQEIANINGGKFSYDLMMGEWLPPFGKGKVADMEFTRIPHQDFGEVVGAAGVKGHSYRDDVAVKFLGADNGLVECRPPPGACLKIRTAPEDGYRPDYLCWEGKDSNLRYTTNYDEKRCFSFRIRTRRDGDGKIVEAYYGKIYGDIVAYTGCNHAIIGTLFTYYLNPTSLDHNLEWDRVHNHCPNPGDVGDHVGDRKP